MRNNRGKRRKWGPVDCTKHAMGQIANEHCSSLIGLEESGQMWLFFSSRSQQGPQRGIGARIGHSMLLGDLVVQGGGGSRVGRAVVGILPSGRLDFGVPRLEPAVPWATAAAWPPRPRSRKRRESSLSGAGGPSATDYAARRRHRGTPQEENEIASSCRH